MEPRDFNDPQYKAWRLAVKKRDRFRCRMPNCKRRKRLHAHHIKRWADWPQLRFVVKNGITLCHTCHKRIEGIEETYEALFLQILSPCAAEIMIKMLVGRYGRKEKDA